MKKKNIFVAVAVAFARSVGYWFEKKHDETRKAARLDDDHSTKRALQLASVASMIDLFNADNIKILLSLGYKVDVATNFSFGSITSQERVDEYKTELIEHGIGVYNIPIPRSLSMVKNMLTSYRQIKELVESNRYDIVHCHSPIGSVICRLACRKVRKVGTKVIYTAHGFHFYKGASLKAWLLYYPAEWICSLFTDLIITINQEDYRAAKGFHTCNVEYVPGIGIHVDDIKVVGEGLNRDVIRAGFEYKDSDFVFMSAGQISVRKNHEVVIRALELMRNTGDLGDIKYLIVGFGEEEERLKGLVHELGLTDVVTFAGFRSDVKELLYSVDAFIFPSIQEGLPVALMEAMSAGLPIVASRIRGNVDLIQDGVGGYLVDCHDSRGFSVAMRLVATSDTKSITLMSKVNQRVIKKFDTRIVNEKMRKVY